MSGENEKNSDMLVITFAVVILCIFFYFIYKQFEPYFNAAMGYTAWLHVLPFSQASRWIPFLNDIPFVGNWLFRPADITRAYLERGGFAFMGIENNDRSSVLLASGRCAMLIYAPFFIYAAIKGSVFRVDQTYRKLHNLESIIREQAKKWPGMLLASVVNPRDMVDLTAENAAKAVHKSMNSKKPDGLGKLITGRVVDINPDARMRSATPEEWMLMKGLVWSDEEYAKLRDGMFAVKDTQYTFPQLWENLTVPSISEVLEDQLRNRWKSIKELPPALRALFGVFILFYDGGKTVKKANALLDDLMVLGAWADKNNMNMDDVVMAEDGFMKKIDGIIASKDGQRFEEICKAHAYVESALPTALRTCREGRGVLAPASFLWMKRYNRLWWYILNNTGGEAVMIECAGAMAHSKSEIQIGMPLLRPCVWQAAKSLHEDYLDLDPARIAKRHEDRVRIRKLSESLSLMEHDVERAQKRGAYDEKWGDET